MKKLFLLPIALFFKNPVRTRESRNAGILPAVAPASPPALAAETFDSRGRERLTARCRQNSRRDAGVTTLRRSWGAGRSLMADMMVAFVALIGFCGAANAQTTTLPSTPGLNFQTSGPSRAPTIGDWYTTATSASGDRVHRFAVGITAQMIAASSGGSVSITINDAESTAGATALKDEVAGTSDPTRFELRTGDGATLLSSRTIASGSPDGTSVVFTVSAPGTYQVTSVTGALPISGNNAADLNDDDNSFSISVPSYGADPVLQSLIGQYQGSFQQDTGSTLTVPFYFFVGPGTSTLR